VTSTDRRPPDDVSRDEWSRRTSLRDGRPVLLRQIRPEDRDRLSEGLQRLSPASRYLRFHTVIDELTPEQLDHLTRVDHVDHEAIVALDLDDLESPGVGVARYIREQHEPTVAEAAVTVADEYHGQGAGTILLGALASRAREHGITTFRNYVLEHNRAMLDVFDHLGADRHLQADGLWCVDLPLPETEVDLPASGAGRAFLAVARDGYRLSSLFPPVWGRLRRRLDEGDPDDDTAADDTLDDTDVGLQPSDLDVWLSQHEQHDDHPPGSRPTE
jgi:GNAT superfamily N-acetyltransferase